MWNRPDRTFHAGEAGGLPWIGRSAMPDVRCEASGRRRTSHEDAGRRLLRPGTRRGPDPLIDLDEVTIGTVEVRCAHVPIHVGPRCEGDADTRGLQLLAGGIHVVHSGGERDVAAPFALRLRNEERLGGVATSPSHLGGRGVIPQSCQPGVAHSRICSSLCSPPHSGLDPWATRT